MIDKLISRFLNYKKTNFTAGGLKPTTQLKTAKNSLNLDKKFVAPRTLDFRDMCIKTSDQFSTPHCAGYATAGMIEVKNWQIKNYPEQVNGDLIYAEAKKIDDDQREGTSLDSAMQAAIDLKLIRGTMKFIGSGFDDIKFCIHKHLTFVAGFSITDEWNYVTKNGIILPRDKYPTRFLGGHAVLVCGYNSDGIFIQNSWGTTWGKYGFALLPWDLVFNQYMYGAVII